MRKKFLKIILILVILLLIIGVFIIIFINKRDNSIKLKEEKKIIEYGNTYNPTIKDLIDLEKYYFIDNTKIKIELNCMVDKDYPEVGEYQVNIHYKNILLTQIVEVVDTIAPKITIQEKIEIDQGTDLNKYDFKNLIKIEDLSKTNEPKIDYSNIDTNKTGEYFARISVEDIYENKTEIEFKIIIIEKKQEEVKEIKQEENNNTSNTKTKDNTVSNVKENNKTKNNSKKTNSTINTDTRTNNTSTVEENSKPKTETPKQNTTDNTDKWCYEGGKKHYAGNGKNEHGYYKTFDEAYDALKKYINGKDSGRYKVGECWCGLYYFWVIEE